MKILSKLSLALLILSSGTAQANYFYSLASFVMAAGRHYNALVVPIVSAKNCIDYRKNLSDAPEIVVNFCEKKLKAQGLNPCFIQIKVKQECELLGTFFNKLIVFSPAAANHFKNALENPTGERSAEIVKIYSTLIDREISHLKGNDGMKRVLVLTGASLTAYAATSYFVNSSRFSHLFATPTNIQEYLIAAFSYGMVNASTSGFVSSLFTVYTRHQESQADAYAISQANDPDALRCAAKFFDRLDNDMERPAAAARAKKMREAADALEAAQATTDKKILVEEITLAA